MGILWAFAIKGAKLLIKRREWFAERLRQLFSANASHKRLVKGKHNFGMAILDHKILLYASEQSTSLNSRQVPMPHGLLLFRLFMNKTNEAAQPAPQPFKQAEVCVADSDQCTGGFALSFGQSNAALSVKNTRHICSNLWSKLERRLFSHRIGGLVTSSRAPCRKTRTAIGATHPLRRYSASWAQWFSGPADSRAFSLDPFGVLPFILSAAQQTVALSWLLVSSLAARTHGPMLVNSRHEITISRLA